MIFIQIVYFELSRETCLNTLPVLFGSIKVSQNKIKIVLYHLTCQIQYFEMHVICLHHLIKLKCTL